MFQFPTFSFNSLLLSDKFTICLRVYVTPLTNKRDKRTDELRMMMPTAYRRFSPARGFIGLRPVVRYRLLLYLYPARKYSVRQVMRALCAF
jgi:hypothetical protein